MSKTVRFVETIFFGPLELAALLNAVTYKSTMAKEDANNFATGGASDYAPGLSEVSFEGSGFYDAATVTSDPDRTLFGRPQIAICVTETNPVAVGDFAVFSRMQTFDYTIGLQVGKMRSMSFTASSSGSMLIRGAIRDYAVVSATGNGTGAQVGAVAAGKAMYAGLWVPAFTGAPTLDIVVQSDDNSGFTTPTSRIVFTQMTGKGWQWKKLDGPITDDYWRAARTKGGTGTMTYALALGIL